MTARQQQLFTDEDVISSYTDEQAIDDGMLVTIGKRDRCTHNLFAALVRDLPKGAQPPDRWPVSLLEWFGAGDGEKGDNMRALAALKGMIGTHGPNAHRIYEQNIDGGILTLWIDREGDGAIIGLREQETDVQTVAVRVWLIPNEVGGLTAMFPEDY